MSKDVFENKLEKLGFELPLVPAPQGSYVPFVISGGHVYLSGALPVVDGQLVHCGIVGGDINIEHAREASQICILNLLANLKVALGTLDRVTQVVRIGGFVRATPEYSRHPEVINAASDLIVDIFGETGRHARFAVGVASLPRNSCVEIDAIIAFE